MTNLLGSCGRSSGFLTPSSFAVAILGLVRRIIGKVDNPTKDRRVAASLGVLFKAVTERQMKAHSIIMVKQPIVFSSDYHVWQKPFFF